MYDFLKITAEEAFRLRSARDVENDYTRKQMRLQIFHTIKQRLSLPTAQKIVVTLDTDSDQCMVVRDKDSGQPLGATPNMMMAVEWSRLKALVELDGVQPGYMPPDARLIGRGTYVSGLDDALMFWFPYSE